jgi:hypothetical protein
MKPGDTFRPADSTVDIHLWVIISDPGQSECEGASGVHRSNFLARSASRWATPLVIQSGAVSPLR